MNILSKTAITLAVVYVGMAGGVYVMQRSLMFSPATDRVQPDSTRNHGIQEIILESSTGELMFSWYGLASPSQPTVLYLHGNGGSVSTRQGIQRQFLDKGYGLFMVGYPGYGGSEGSPTEETLVGAAEIAYSYLKDSGVAPKRIIIFGESLGSSVALQLAEEADALAVVLAAPMYSISEIAQQQYPFLPVALLLKDPFLSFEHISNVDEPILMFHGSEDEAIPIESGKRLFALANEPKQFSTIETAGHNNLFDFEVLEILDRFLAEYSES